MFARADPMLPEEPTHARSEIDIGRWGFPIGPSFASLPDIVVAAAKHAKAPGKKG